MGILQLKQDEKAILKKVRRADTLPGQSLISKSKAAQLASEVGFLRRRLSFASVQGHARLLLDPLLLLGDGAGEADGRRDRALAARRAEANEMRAQHTRMLIGRNIRALVQCSSTSITNVSFQKLFVVPSL